MRDEKKLRSLLGFAKKAGKVINGTDMAVESVRSGKKNAVKLFILASDASYTAEDVLADENLKDCTAVKNGNVYHLPADVESWDSPVPSGFLGSFWMASVLHGDLITEADRDAVINEFYDTFYGFTYCED